MVAIALSTSCFSHAAPFLAFSPLLCSAHQDKRLHCEALEREVVALRKQCADQDKLLVSGSGRSDTDQKTGKEEPRGQGSGMR